MAFNFLFCNFFDRHLKNFIMHFLGKHAYKSCEPAEHGRQSLGGGILFKHHFSHPFLFDFENISSNLSRKRTKPKVDGRNEAGSPAKVFH